MNLATTIFAIITKKHEDLKTAYQISQNFKYWYDYQNHIKSGDEIKNNLYRWYEQARQVDEFQTVIKMIRKHENEILIFSFLTGKPTQKRSG